MKKALFITSAIVVVLLAGFLYFKFWFVYSEGINEGDINYFQKEGFIFKTYEGKMIQSGFHSKSTQSSVQSNEFKFSVEEESVANQLNMCSSTQVKLHWRRYLGTLPWRGKSQFVVDQIISSGQGKTTTDVPVVPIESTQQN